MGIFTRVFGEALADWIHPNVSGYACGVVSLSENVVVEFLLPEHVVMSLQVFVRGCSFEVFNKRKQFARKFEAGNQGVKMIRHHAVGVDGESIGNRLLAEVFDQPLRIL